MSARAHHRRQQRSRPTRLGRRAIIRGALAALGLTLGCALAVGSFGAADVARATSAPARSLFELLDRRSPGARTEAELTKTRLLGDGLRIRAQTPNLAEALAPASPAYLPAAIANLDTDAPAPAVGLSGAALASAYLATGGDSSIGAKLVASSSGFSGSPPAEFPTVPVPAVPEPGTWLMAIFGFGILGWRLRRTHERPGTMKS